MMSRTAQKHLLRSMGMEVVYDEVDWFHPDHPKCDPELQQYVIARRSKDQPVSGPQPSPQHDDQKSNDTGMPQPRMAKDWSG